MPQRLENVAMDLPTFTEVLQETEQILEKCFAQFQLDEVFLSFNGGKDCTVLLDVTINVLRNLSKKRDLSKELKVVYIRTHNPFNEIEDFVKEIEMHYGLRLVVTEGELKEALQEILESDRKLKACLMGTRRTDPHSENFKFMQKTDADWPQIVRVSPLLNWSYHQIWGYILQRQVPYCSLYDRGYTSIGSVSNTRPNEALAYTENGRVRYRAAWLLPEGSMERAGRGKIRADLTNGADVSRSADLTNGTDLDRDRERSAKASKTRATETAICGSNIAREGWKTDSVELVQSVKTNE